MYKPFVCPHLDYGDIIYDQAHNALLYQKLESLQYNTCLAITGAIRGLSREKLYQELGFESLQQRRWNRKLCSFCKVFKNESPRYLLNIIPTSNPTYSTRNHVNIPLYKTNHILFKNPFFHLPLSNGIMDTYRTFKNTILNFIRHSPNSQFECHNPQGIKFLTRLRLAISHFREHKFKHSFQDSLNPLCKCVDKAESTSHFLLHCAIYNNGRCSLLSTIRNIDCKSLEFTDCSLTQTLLYGNPSFAIIQFTELKCYYGHFLSTKRFEEALF